MNNSERHNKKNNMKHYTLKFQYDGQEYQYDLDSLQYKPKDLVEQAHAILYENDWSQVEFQIIKHINMGIEKVVYQEDKNHYVLVDYLG